MDVVGTSAADVYGLLRTAGMDVALPLSALREVVPHPGHLTGVPVQARGLLGAMRLRSIVLPVVDLCPLLGLTEALTPSAGAHEQVVVVVAHDDRLIGLLVDEVCGVARVCDDDQRAIGATGPRLLVSHVFQHGPSSTMVSVLDAEVLLTLPGVPTVAEQQRVGDARPRAVTELDTPQGHATVVRCGDHRLAVDIGDLSTTIPLAGLTPSLLTGGDCLGTVVHDGREVPVLDTTALLGLGEARPTDLEAGLVLELERGLVVLAVTALEQLIPLPSELIPLSSWAVRRPDLLRGLVESESESCLLLDGDALRADTDLASYAALNTLADGSAPALSLARTMQRVADVGPTYLTYTIGRTEVATPLDQVAEILPVPSRMTPSPLAHVLGLTVHRGSAVAVVCLATLVAPDASTNRMTTPPTCLLLVDLDGEQVAFAVQALGSIQPRVWDDKDAPTPGPTVRDRVIQDAPLVTVSGLDKLLPDLDLRSVGRTLRQENHVVPHHGNPGRPGAADTTQVA